MQKAFEDGEEEDEDELLRFAAARHASDFLKVSSHLIESVCKVALQQSISAQIRHRILHISNKTGEVDELVRKLTFADFVNILCETTSGTSRFIQSR